MKKKRVIDMQSVRYDEGEEAVDRCLSILPGDLMLDILQRLPVKSLLRFKSISKAWKAVISSNMFKNKHLNYQKHKKNVEVKYLHPLEDNGILEISKEDDGSVTTKRVGPFNFYPFGSSLPYVFFAGSYNGLVCVIFCYYQDKFLCFSYGIWNPATRKIHYQPPPQPYFTDLPYHKKEILAGFSYIPRTSCYKLVQIVYGASLETCVQVLNIGANSSWKEIVCKGKLEAICIRHTRDSSVVVNGCMHWLGYLNGIGVVMVSFDMDEEVFTQTPLPYCKGSLKNSGYKLCVLEDNLATFVSSPREVNVNNYGMFEVWSYERTSQSWIKRFSFGPLTYDIYPIGFLGDDGEIIIHNQSSPFKLYNHKNKQYNALPCRKWCKTWCNSGYQPYTESLIDV